MSTESLNALIISQSIAALQSKRANPKLQEYQVSVGTPSDIAQNLHYFCSKISLLCNAIVTLTFVGSANYSSGYQLKLVFNEVT